MKFFNSLRIKNKKTFNNNLGIKNELLKLKIDKYNIFNNLGVRNELFKFKEEKINSCKI